MARRRLGVSLLLVVAACTGSSQPTTTTTTVAIAPEQSLIIRPVDAVSDEALAEAASVVARRLGNLVDSIDVEVADGALLVTWVGDADEATVAVAATTPGEFSVGHVVAAGELVGASGEFDPADIDWQPLLGGPQDCDGAGTEALLAMDAFEVFAAGFTYPAYCIAPGVLTNADVESVTSRREDVSNDAQSTVSFWFVSVRLTEDGSGRFTALLDQLADFSPGDPRRMMAYVFDGRVTGAPELAVGLDPTAIDSSVVHLVVADENDSVLLAAILDGGPLPVELGAGGAPTP